MNGEKIADIRRGAEDFTGSKIVTIFSLAPETYAIYVNEDRVVVQYADDPELADRQRRVVALLAPVRGEISSLIDDWRDHRWAYYRNKARRYDRRTADALIVALQGDGETAKTLLQAVRNDILDERSSLGRMHYVCWAFVAGIVMVGVSLVLTLLLAKIAALTGAVVAAGTNPALSSAFGCLGAMFSIAIAIRGRTVQTDLRFRDNLLDAALRMLIGAISAYLLLTLARSRIVDVSLGDLGKLDPQAVPGSFSAAEIVVAFLAGFSERLVGNLLDDKIIPGLTKGGDTAVDKATSRTLPNPGPAEPAPGVELLPPRTPAGEVADRSITDDRIDETEVAHDIEPPPTTGGADKPWSRPGGTKDLLSDPAARS